jgi:hypothetical protein
MKASNKIPEPLFDKKSIAKLPPWVQSTMALSEAITPLVEKLAPVVTFALLLDIISKLLGR